MTRPLVDRTFAQIILEIHDAHERVNEATRARQRCINWSGAPIAGGNGGGNRSSGHSDPTARAATTTIDPAGQARVQIEQAAIKVRDSLYDLIALSARWNDDQIADEQLDAWNRRCVVCEDHTNTIVASQPGLTNEDGTLLRLCQAHHQFRELYSTDPTPEITRLLQRHPDAVSTHRPGRKALSHLMLEQMPDTYHAHHPDPTGRTIDLRTTGALGATGTWKDRT